MALLIPLGYAVAGALGLITAGTTAAVIVHEVKQAEIAKLRNEDYLEVEYELTWTVNGKQINIKKKFKGKKKDYLEIIQQEYKMIAA
jgi:hypothetical protein